MTYQLKVARSVASSIAETLPEAVAAAVLEFVTGPLVDNPHRVGKPLRAPLGGKWSARRGQYRVIYQIDEATNTVTVLVVRHRRDAYS